MGAGYLKVVTFSKRMEIGQIFNWVQTQLKVLEGEEEYFAGIREVDEDPRVNVSVANSDPGGGVKVDQKSTVPK